MFLNSSVQYCQTLSLWKHNANILIVGVSVPKIKFLLHKKAIAIKQNYQFYNKKSWPLKKYGRNLFLYSIDAASLLISQWFSNNAYLDLELQFELK